MIVPQLRPKHEMSRLDMVGTNYMLLQGRGQLFRGANIDKYIKTQPNVCFCWWLDCARVTLGYPAGAVEELLRTKQVDLSIIGIRVMIFVQSRCRLRLLALQ